LIGASSMSSNTRCTMVTAGKQADKRISMRCMLQLMHMYGISGC
jgi:hypothetical protein